MGLMSLPKQLWSGREGTLLTSGFLGGPGSSDSDFWDPIPVLCVFTYMKETLEANVLGCIANIVRYVNTLGQDDYKLGISSLDDQWVLSNF